MKGCHRMNKGKNKDRKANVQTHLRTRVQNGEQFKSTGLLVVIYMNRNRVKILLLMVQKQIVNNGSYKSWFAQTLKVKVGGRMVFIEAEKISRLQLTLTNRNMEFCKEMVFL